MADVTVYGADWCPDCRRSKRLLDRLGVAYLYRDLDAEPGAAQEAEALSGRQSIPVVVLPDGNHLVEPSDADLRTHLVAAGLVAD
ncbi:MAG: glutaredoxin family protein [Candidatus Nanopelagicales bacterium]|jgi:glutaredoxin|nr:glutaredoxin family protein [Candidatus Nanopelagicales bacterium]